LEKILNATVSADLLLIGHAKQYLVNAPVAVKMYFFHPYLIMVQKNPHAPYG
jgi:hypothetical protein